ncbi:glutamine-synthetase adenylyltransferase [Aliiruegeria sabulilitoris]|uniref:[protein-PII] uridylyltransferase family protein n=1 Tax=Aliiruegeria sabulilitoris TaxID=1510458 RepID=UPI00082C4016|nr:glutamine-synthetase adenylyltransferase [Aliiruegeria sabulilitoris]NDR56474.1 glutamine-synthetase adenylyltransferase [Pseudoruegeria sp. M32A2M]
MSFIARITRSPIPFDAEAGADAQSLFAELPPEMREVLAGTAGCSPYLRGLMARQPEWLAEALFRDPGEVLASEFERLRPMSQTDLKTGLRQAKGRVALLAGLADLAGVWSLEEVTGALTDFADLSVDLAMKAVLAREFERGKFPGKTLDDLDDAGGMVALAMGKMGAHELNYSSDIDLIMLFDESRYEMGDFLEARSGFIKATRRMTSLLSDITGEGYVWRTDLRLRPDPSVTPVCLAMEAAERYYESVGRTWERAAHIKARPCGGDIGAGEAYLERLRPFIWRRHLDFAAIQDAHDMRLKIKEHKGLHETGSLEGRNLKLGPGGIREIEFFTQTRQIIAGGRDASLRLRGTVPALARLAETGWIPHRLAASFTDHYRYLREIEHRVQMVADARTHALPTSAEGFDRIARMCGQGDTAAFKAGIAERLVEVREAAEGFFAPGKKGGGASTPTAEPEIVSRWRRYPALRSERAQEIFERLKPDLLARLNAAPRPDEALSAFDGFLSGLPAGVQLFSMFEANPHLRALIVDIASTAPALASYLSRNSGVLDAVIGGRFFAPWPGKMELCVALGQLLDETDDYEEQLDETRRWLKEWHFRVGVHLLRGIVDSAEAGRQYADLAEAVLTALLPAVVENFAHKHGRMPGRGGVAVGMGSLGAGWINSRSDLDLIMIYDAGDAEVSDGPRPLPVVQYYARLTKAVLTAITAPTSEGRLYEVDMRLRPSGKQGPVATSLSAFESYQKNEAWTWEHLALTRARPVAGSLRLKEDVEAVRLSVLEQPRDVAKVLEDVRDMRRRLSEAKGQQGPLDVKRGPGGMQDIELLAQAGALLTSAHARRTPPQLAAAARHGWLSKAEAEQLTATYRLARSVQSVGRLLVDGPLDPETLGQGAKEVLARETGLEDLDALMAELAARRAVSAEIIDAALERTDIGGKGKA